MLRRKYIRRLTLPEHDKHDLDTGQRTLIGWEVYGWHTVRILLMLMLMLSRGEHGLVLGVRWEVGVREKKNKRWRVS